MNLVGLAVLLLTAEAIAPEQGMPRSFHLAAAVASVDGHCVYWTGDAGLTAQQFRAHLHDSVSSSADVTIYHGKEVPERCLKKARRLALRAGFQKIKLEPGSADLSVP